MAPVIRLPIILCHCIIILFTELSNAEYESKSQSLSALVNTQQPHNFTTHFLDAMADLHKTEILEGMHTHKGDVTRALIINNSGSPIHVSVTSLICTDSKVITAYINQLITTLERDSRVYSSVCCLSHNLNKCYSHISYSLIPVQDRCKRG